MNQQKVYTMPFSKVYPFYETLSKDAPGLNPLRKLITGVVCGIRVEEIEEPLMQEIRYLDKLIDELAKGKVMEKILRANA